MAGINNTRTV